MYIWGPKFVISRTPTPHPPARVQVRWKKDTYPQDPGVVYTDFSFGSIWATILHSKLLSGNVLRKSDYLTPQTLKLLKLPPLPCLRLKLKIWHYITMPVHFKVASHDAQPIERASHLTKPEELLAKTRTPRCAGLLQSSFVSKGVDLSTVFYTTNGFVNTVTTAYNSHHHLIFKFVNILHVSSTHWSLLILSSDRTMFGLRS